MGRLLFAAADAKGTVNKLMLFINKELATNGKDKLYRNTDFYAWRSGARPTPNTVSNLLRPFVIKNNFSKKQSEKILELIETSEAKK